MPYEYFNKKILNFQYFIDLFYKKRLLLGTKSCIKIIKIEEFVRPSICIFFEILNI